MEFNKLRGAVAHVNHFLIHSDIQNEQIDNIPHLSKAKVVIGKVLVS